MQSVPITTDVVSSNLDQGEVYKIMRYNWNIVESGVKHHETKQPNHIITFYTSNFQDLLIDWLLLNLQRPVF
jgi:hypothetical protein